MYSLVGNANFSYVNFGTNLIRYFAKDNFISVFFLGCVSSRQLASWLELALPGMLHHKGLYLRVAEIKKIKFPAL